MEKRRFALIFSIALVVVSFQSVIVAKPLAKITVEAGKHDRIDTPVSVKLDGISCAELVLEEIKGTQRIPVAAQIAPGSPPRLWWILSGTTGAGEKRVYELVKGESVKATDVEVIKNDSFLQIQAAGNRILRYNHAPVPPPNGVSKIYNRSGFIHPLWSPTGAVLTNIHPPDHIHHMGIWMPWTRTKFEGRPVDFWNLKKSEGTVRFVKFHSTTSGPVYGGFQAEQEHVVLKAAEAEKVALDETWDVRVYNVGGADKGYWLWDFVSTQRCATESPLYLPKYRYGGLGFRGSAEWKEGKADYLTSEGKTRKDGHGTRARWCDMYGQIGDGWAGVAIMSHPKNFRYPEPVRIWPTGEIFFNFAPSQQGNWKMEPGQDYTFRYRFYVHEGKVNVADAERLWYDFTEPPEVKLQKVLQE